MVKIERGLGSAHIDKSKNYEHDIKLIVKVVPSMRAPDDWTVKIR